MSAPVMAAHFIKDIEAVNYPQGILRPRSGLDANPRNRNLVYERDFLLQFMPVCNGKPAHLLDLIDMDIHNAKRAKRTERQISQEDSSSVALQRQTRSLLNKLTLKNFEPISGQILKWTYKSRNEKDAHTLHLIISIIFKHAINEALTSSVYARLCRWIMERISPQIRDYEVYNHAGEPVAGALLVKRYLLDHCQEYMERELRVQNPCTVKGSFNESYAIYRARRCGLGYITFVGELFRLQLLAERTIHEFTRRLLGNANNPVEWKVEWLCNILSNNGSILDTKPQARSQLDIYFARIQDLTQSPKLAPRSRFMLLDLLELRERKWVSRQQVAALTILASVHKKTAEDVQEGEMSHRIASISHTGSRYVQGLGSALPESIGQRNGLDLLPHSIHANEIATPSKSCNVFENGSEDKCIPTNTPDIDARKISEDARKGFALVRFGPRASVDRSVRALLNKLAMKHYDSISDQIVEWANMSEKEKDARTLIQVIRLVFEKATDEPKFSEMYAHLCRTMMMRISPQVQDNGTCGPMGKPIAGGQLFRKHLLSRCREEFEHGWRVKEAIAAATYSKATEEKAESDKKGDGEVELYSDEYYAAQKAKRRGLGVVKLIGELFKLKMLTERIMHDCVKKLLGNVDNPEEEEIESLCKLLTTVGSILDNNTKARAHMDIYFSRMKNLTQCPNISPRVQFILQDVVELRERKWVPPNQVAAPTTLSAVHEQAAKEKEERYTSHRFLGMPRTGLWHSQDHSQVAQGGPDGWMPVAGGNSNMRAQPKAGDLSQFGKIGKGAPMTFAPASVLNKGKYKQDSIIQTGSTTNTPPMLSSDAEPIPNPIQSAKSRPPNRRFDGQHTQPNLPPRTFPTGETVAPEELYSASMDESENAAVLTKMSEADAKKKIDEDAKEFFAVRNLDEAEEYFFALPPIHHSKLVEKLTGIAIEGKQNQAQLTADLFARGLSKNLTTPGALVEGLSSLAEFIDDLAIDAPSAPKLFALIVKGANLDDDQKRQIASKGMDPDSLAKLFTGKQL